MRDKFDLHCEKDITHRASLITVKVVLAFTVFLFLTFGVSARTLLIENHNSLDDVNSSDMDGVCSVANSFMFRNATTWGCLDRNNVTGSSGGTGNVTADGLLNYVAIFAGNNYLHHLSTDGSSIETRLLGSVNSFTFGNNVTSGFILYYPVVNPLYFFIHEMIEINRTLYLQQNPYALYTEGKILSGKDIELNLTYWDGESESYSTGCIVFNDRTRQCTAATSSSANASANGNSPFVPYFTNSTNLQNTSLYYNETSGNVNFNNNASIHLAKTTVGIVGTYPAFYKNSKDEIYQVTCGNSQYFTTTADGVWQCSNLVVDTNTYKIPYTFGSAAKITANATYSYLTMHGAAGGASAGYVMRTDSSACDWWGITYNITSYATTGRINFTAFKNGTQDASTEATITGNGNGLISINSAGLKTSKNQVLSVAAYKKNGTFSLGNIVFIMECDS